MTAKKPTATQSPLILVRFSGCWGSDCAGGGAACAARPSGLVACGVVSSAGWPEGVSAGRGVWVGCGSVVIWTRPLAFSSIVSPFPARPTRCYACPRRPARFESALTD